MMKISRCGIFVLLLLAIGVGSSCGFYNRIMARKNLVDGAKSYNERNFKQAEERFRSAVEYDPELTLPESKTAQLFLARTIHSEFAGNRINTDKAELAITEYKKALTGYMSDFTDKKAAADGSPDDEKAQKALKQTGTQIGSIVRSVASLHENLQQTDKWDAWQTEQAANEQLPEAVRASAYVALAAKQLSCADEISDTDETKKTVKEDGKDVFKFSKPSDEEDFDKLKKCVDQGSEYIDKAVGLDAESDSVWSYKTSLIEQQRRIAEMNGETEKKESLKKDFAEAKEKFKELSDKRKKAEEAEAKRKAEAEAEKSGRKIQEGDAKESDGGESEDKSAEATEGSSDDK